MWPPHGPIKMTQKINQNSKINGNGYWVMVKILNRVVMYPFWEMDS